jgi:hypothetical protein
MVVNMVLEARDRQKKGQPENLGRIELGICTIAEPAHILALMPN